MQIKAPSIPTNHRAQVLSALAALVVAGGSYGVIAIATNDDQSTQSSNGPVVTNVAHGRVLDGSPILRGTANRVDPSRVLDGSPLLRVKTNHVDTSRVLDGSPLVRGVTPEIAPHPRLDGAPFLRRSAPTPATALQPPKGRPEGFRSK
jgi:hypothetical protein